jgi:hypothetical protein
MKAILASILAGTSLTLLIGCRYTASDANGLRLDAATGAIEAADPNLSPYTLASFGNQDYAKLAFEGVTLDVPRHWEVLKGEELKNYMLSAKAIAGLSSSTQYHALVRSRPAPSQATVIVGTTKVDGLTKDAFDGTTSQELKQITDGVAAQYRNSGLRLKQIKPAKLVRIGGRSAVLLELVEEVSGPGTDWNAQMYYFSSTNKMISVRLSCDSSKQAVFHPIFQSMIRSIKF